jgi:formylglycine-generating enzyme required for sulfatase activity
MSPLEHSAALALLDDASLGANTVGRCLDHLLSFCGTRRGKPFADGRGRNRQMNAAGAVITNSIGMKLALILPGTFVMGSPAGERGRFDHEGPLHEVQITRPFYFGVFAVTQEEFQRVMGTSAASSWATLGLARLVPKKN